MTFWAKTSHRHSGDIKGLFYILWKGHYTTRDRKKKKKTSRNCNLLLAMYYPSMLLSLYLCW